MFPNLLVGDDDLIPILIRSLTMATLEQFHESMKTACQRRFGFADWPYASTYQKLVQWLCIIYEKLSPASVNDAVTLPSFEIKKIGRTRYASYKHAYTSNGILGNIIMNATYIATTPSVSQLIGYIVLMAHELCHCIQYRENSHKTKVHGKEFNEIMARIGLVYHGPKVPIQQAHSFTQDSWLYQKLSEEFEQDVDHFDNDVDHIVYAELLPKPPKKEKATQTTFIEPAPAIAACEVIDSNSTQECAPIPQELIDLRATNELLLKELKELKAEKEALKSQPTLSINSVSEATRQAPEATKTIPTAESIPADDTEADNADASKTAYSQYEQRIERLKECAKSYLKYGETPFDGLADMLHRYWHSTFSGSHMPKDRIANLIKAWIASKTLQYVKGKQDENGNKFVQLAPLTVELDNAQPAAN